MNFIASGFGILSSGLCIRLFYRGHELCSLTLLLTPFQAQW